jgi:hypothetical protein
VGAACAFIKGIDVIAEATKSESSKSPIMFCFFIFYSP